MVVMAQDKKDLLQKLEDSEARINALRQRQSWLPISLSRRNLRLVN